MKINLKLLAIMVLLMSFMSAQAGGIPQLDDALFSQAKQVLLYFADGDYESAAAQLEFVDADELEKFVTGNFMNMGADVQTYASVAFWSYNSWFIAVPLYTPSDGSVETIVFRSDDGLAFSGYKYCLWEDVETEYSACDYVIWHEEYSDNEDLFIIE